MSLLLAALEESHCEWALPVRYTTTSSKGKGNASAADGGHPT